MKQMILKFCSRSLICKKDGVGNRTDPGATPRLTEKMYAMPSTSTWIERSDRKLVTQTQSWVDNQLAVSLFKKHSLPHLIENYRYI